MKISELKIGEGKVNIEGVVKGISDTRAFNKYGRDLKVANAILEDESGAIKLTLWNEEIMKVKEGAKVKITNGFVNEFQGEKQLTAGKFGKLEVLD
jgi:replication factor A1